METSQEKQSGTFIYGDKIQHHCYFEKTMNLRWLNRYNGTTLLQNSNELTLQQASKCISCGKIRWDNIPVIEEGDLNE